MLNSNEVDSELVDSKIFDPEEIKKVGNHSVKIFGFGRLLSGTLLCVTHATFPGWADHINTGYLIAKIIK